MRTVVVIPRGWCKGVHVTFSLFTSTSILRKGYSLHQKSILMREETGVPGENLRSQVEIDWNSAHIQ